MLLETIFLAMVAFVLAYYYCTRTFSYWRDKGVVFVKPYPLVGSMWKQITLQEHMSELFRRIYFEYPDQPFVGFYQGLVPSILIRDKDLIKQILVKDFSHFTDHGIKLDEEGDALMARNLFNLRGQQWKHMRMKLAPTFTSGRMKSMFPMVLECATNLEIFISEKFVKTGKDLELNDILQKYTTNVIASNVFGIACDSLNEPDNKFRSMSRLMLETNLIQATKLALLTFIPGIAPFIGGTYFKPECAVYFRSLVQDIIAFRTKSEEKRNDFMQLLIELMEKGKLTAKDDEIQEDEYTDDSDAFEKLSETDLLAQAMVFFLAGFETSSTAMTCALFELSRRPDLQLKARRHIEEVLGRHNGQVTYNALQEMTYLDWIFQESLRKYPSLVVFRECTKTYLIPGTEITIEKGTPLVIPNYGLHYDPEYFPDPEEFNPERFNDEEMIKKNQYLYLPFGEGPRLCIGKRFAYMQSKLGLLTFLRKFEVQVSSQTRCLPKWDPMQFLLNCKGKVFVRIVPAPLVQQ